MEFFSLQFLVFVALLVLAYELGPVRPYRRVILSLANLVFLLTFLENMSDALALAGFVLLSYGMLLAVQRWRWRGTPAIFILLAVLVLLVLKRYYFLEGWLPEGLLQHSLSVIGIDRKSVV